MAIETGGSWGCISTEDAGADNDRSKAVCSVRGIVLAGVHAWGDFVLDRVRPRPLIPVAARPLITHVITWLRDAGVGRASLCANSDTSHLRRELRGGEAWGIDLDYYEDVMPRGPAGCVRDAVTNGEAEPLVVVEGTICPHVPLDDVLQDHAESGAALTVVVHGRGPAGDRESPLEASGVYVFSRAALEHIPQSGYQDIKESLIPRLHAQGAIVRTYVVGATTFPRVTSVASYLGANGWSVSEMIRRQAAPPGFAIRGEACVHETATVDASAKLMGPVLVDRGARVGAKAMVVGPAVIGSGSTVERGTVVSRSVLWDETQIGAEAAIDRCVITDKIEVPARAVVRDRVTLDDDDAG